MKKGWSILLAAMFLLTAVTAYANGPAEPWKGDQGGVYAAKIEEALKNGNDPSVYVNLPMEIEPEYYSTTVIVTSRGTVYNTTVTSDSTYASFWSHAQKWYNNTYLLQQQFGTFSSYFANCYNTESSHYFYYGHNLKMTFDQYLLMIIAMNKMPSFT